MIWNIPNFPVNTPMTDQDLESFGLRVEGLDVTWENRTFHPLLHKVYISNVEKCRKLPVWVGLYKFENMWYYVPRLQILSLSAGQTLTVWNFPFQGDPIQGVVYQATDDETAFDAFPQAFIVDDYGSYVNIIGLRHYCEALHIPASINGLPVRKVCIRPDYRIENLRSLSAEEGVEQLYFDFARCSDISRIDLPPSLKLMTPPTGIRQTPWFQNQTGAVYLQGWYCGWQGLSHPDCLTVKEGTYGILPDADAGAPWRAIELPESLCYLGDGAFSRCCFREFPIPESCWQWGERVIPRPLLSVMPSFPGPPDGPPETPVLKRPKDLYELGRGGIGRGILPEGFLPLAPRLSYSDVHGWIGEFWYCTEDAKTVGGYVKLRLRDGRPLNIRSFEPFTHLRSLWTDRYIPPFYWFSEEYLSDCLKLMDGGKPTDHQLADLEEAWHRCNPDSFNAWLSWKRQYEQDKKDPYPIVPTKEALAFWSWDRVKTALIKK